LLLKCTHEAEWTPFRTDYFSENLVAPGIDPGKKGKRVEEHERIRSIDRKRKKQKER
jgi:hypothetical protein